MPKRKGDRAKIQKGDLLTVEEQVAVDNMMSGKYSSKKKALLAAGIRREGDLQHPDRVLMKAIKTGYLNKYSKEMSKRFIDEDGKPIPVDQKIASTYIDALEATKFEKTDDGYKEVADHKIRLKSADKIAQVFGFHTDLDLDDDKNRPQVNNFNFFSTSTEKQKEFNNKFIDFIRKEALEKERKVEELKEVEEEDIDGLE